MEWQILFRTLLNFSFIIFIPCLLGKKNAWKPPVGARLVWSPSEGSMVWDRCWTPEKIGHLEPRHNWNSTHNWNFIFPPLDLPHSFHGFPLCWGSSWRISSPVGIIGLCMVAGGACLDQGCCTSHPALLQTANYFQALDLVEAARGQKHHLESEV